MSNYIPLQLRDRRGYPDGTFRFPDKDHILFYYDKKPYRIKEFSHLFKFVVTDNRHNLCNSSLETWPEDVPVCHVNVQDLLEGSEDPRILIDGVLQGDYIGPNPIYEYNRLPKHHYLELANYGIF